MTEPKKVNDIMDKNSVLPPGKYIAKCKYASIKARKTFAPSLSFLFECSEESGKSREVWVNLKGYKGDGVLCSKIGQIAKDRFLASMTDASLSNFLQTTNATLTFPAIKNVNMQVTLDALEYNGKFYQRLLDVEEVKWSNIVNTQTTSDKKDIA